MKAIHPEVAGRDCQECCKFLYDEKSGKRVERFGIGIRRPTTGHGSRPPCSTCPKVPAGHPNPSPAAAVELDERGLKFIEFLDGCRAVNWFPHDPALRYLAGVVRRTERIIKESKENARWARLGVAIMMAGVVKKVRGG